MGWGDNRLGECNVPLPNTGFVAIAAGYNHSVGLKADGSVVAWGNNLNGACVVPAPNTNYFAIAAGRNCTLGLRSQPVTRAASWTLY